MIVTSALPVTVVIFVAVLLPADGSAVAEETDAVLLNVGPAAPEGMAYVEVMVAF